MKDKIILDVRTNKEFCKSHVENAILVESDSDVKLFKKQLIYAIKNNRGNKNSIIEVYCKRGIRAKKAVDILHKLGYINAKSIGGIDKNPLKKYINSNKYKLCKCFSN